MNHEQNEWKLFFKNLNEFHVHCGDFLVQLKSLWDIQDMPYLHMYYAYYW